MIQLTMQVEHLKEDLNGEQKLLWLWLILIINQPEVQPDPWMSQEQSRLSYNKRAYMNITRTFQEHLTQIIRETVPLNHQATLPRPGDSRYTHYTEINRETKNWETKKHDQNERIGEIPRKISK